MCVRVQGAKQKDPVAQLLAGDIDAEHFASCMGTASRERAAKLQAALVAHVARRGALHRTLLAHLDAMAAVLAPSGMLLAQHTYKARLRHRHGRTNSSCLGLLGH